MAMNNGWGNKLSEQFVPFDKNGDQLTYSWTEYRDWVNWTKQLPSARNPYGIEYRPNEEFTDTLTWKERSSVGFNFVRHSNGKTVTMFLADFIDIIPIMEGGWVSGTFVFVKRGGNYGCRLLRETDNHLDDDGYPTDDTLRSIETWPWSDIEGVFKLIKDLWWMQGWGISTTLSDAEKELCHDDIYNVDGPCRYLRFATGGWSGNESLIAALRRNYIIWSATWVLSARGGLHIFRMEKNSDSKA